MLKKCLIVFFISVLMLTACHSPVYNQTEANVADVKLRTQALRLRSNESGKVNPSLVINKGLYVDRTPIDLQRRPLWLQNHIVIRGDQLPFSYYSRTIALGAGSNILTKYQTGLNPTVNLSLNYSGTVQGALNLIAAKTGFVYSVYRNTIYWQEFITRTLDIAFMPGGTDYLLGKAAGGSGASTSTQNMNGNVANFVSSDSSDSEYSNIKGTLSIWKDIDSAIKQMLSPQGKVMVSESTTSVTVRDRPPNVHLVEQFIGNLNHNLSKQVLVRIQILEVNLENSYDFGIDWSLIMRAFNKSPFVFNGNYGTPFKITPLTPQIAGVPVPQFGTVGQIDPTTGKRFIPSYTILFNALNQQGKTSIVSEPRVVCLNNQVSVVRVVRSDGYLASIQNTTQSGTTGGNSTLGQVTSQLTPGTVITGLTLYILPKIMGGRIYLQINADISFNEGFEIFPKDAASGTANSQIQLPHITEKHFNQRSMVYSGEMLVLSGFRQLTNVANANQVLTSQALGGKASQALNRETIVLITPYILPGA